LTATPPPVRLHVSIANCAFPALHPTVPVLPLLRAPPPSGLVRFLFLAPRRPNFPGSELWGPFFYLWGSTKDFFFWLLLLVLLKLVLRRRYPPRISCRAALLVRLFSLSPAPEQSSLPVQQKNAPGYAPPPAAFPFFASFSSDFSSMFPSDFFPTDRENFPSRLFCTFRRPSPCLPFPEDDSLPLDTPLPVCPYRGHPSPGLMFCERLPFFQGPCVGQLRSRFTTFFFRSCPHFFPVPLRLWGASPNPKRPPGPLLAAGTPPPRPHIHPFCPLPSSFSSDHLFLFFALSWRNCPPAPGLPPPSVPQIPFFFVATHRPGHLTPCFTSSRLTSGFYLSLSLFPVFLRCWWPLTLYLTFFSVFYVCAADFRGHVGPCLP